MPALTIKNLPDDIYAHLKTSAKSHHRSLNSEIIYRLERSLMPKKTSPKEVLEAARALRQQFQAAKISAEALDAARHEGRLAS